MEYIGQYSMHVMPFRSLISIIYTGSVSQFLNTRTIPGLMPLIHSNNFRAGLTLDQKQGGDTPKMYIIHTSTMLLLLF